MMLIEYIRFSPPLLVVSSSTLYLILYRHQFLIEALLLYLYATPKEQLSSFLPISSKFRLFRPAAFFVVVV